MVIAGFVLAAVVELTGLALAAVGFRRTWSEYGQGEDFWAPSKRAVRTAARKVENGGRWLLRRPRPAEAVAATAHVALGAARASGRGYVGWGPLPDLSDDAQGFTAAVHDRLNRLHFMIQEDQHALTEERTAREDGEARLRAELAKLGIDVDVKTAYVATGGLRLQVLGWSFVLLGILIGAIVNAADAVNNAADNRQETTSVSSDIVPPLS